MAKIRAKAAGGTPAPLPAGGQLTPTNKWLKIRTPKAKKGE
jgi:hypothetical protein